MIVSINESKSLKRHFYLINTYETRYNMIMSNTDAVQAYRNYYVRDGLGPVIASTLSKMALSIEYNNKANKVLLEYNLFYDFEPMEIIDHYLDYNETIITTFSHAFHRVFVLLDI